MTAYIIHLAILVCIYAILALSLNLIMGYAGLFSLSHAAFFGIGAYATAILTTTYKFNFFASALLGIIIAMTASALIGLVLSKFKGDYYTLGSLGFTIIVYATMLNWQTLTSGPLGIPGIPRPELLGFNFYDNFSF
jgi:branched-chain amino acid transport system permease protein